MPTRSTQSSSKKTGSYKKWLSVLIGLAALAFALITGEVPEELQAILRDDPLGRANTTIESVPEAKRLLLNEIYYDQDTTFYCGSTFTPDKTVSHKKSGYIPVDKKEKRAYRLEWEHIVPAYVLGKSDPAWRDGDPACVDRNNRPFKGRQCAEIASEEFQYMEADMYNLVPAIGEVNGLRSNYSYAMIPGEKRAFGACNMEIEDRKAEPPDNRYGDIARTYMYMDDVYPGHGIISNKNAKLFEAWNTLDPVDAWECERARRIEAAQGNENHIVKAACREANLWPVR